MQTQIAHPRKAQLPLIPMLVAALVVVAIALSLQLALRDRGTTVAPWVTTSDQVTDGHHGVMANHAADMQARYGTTALPVESRPGYGNWPPAKDAGTDGRGDVKPSRIWREPHG